MTDLAGTSSRPRFALVGAGVIGTHHASVMSSLDQDLELVAVVDLDLEKAQRLTSAHGGTAFGLLKDALARATIDVVVVCTPTGRHAMTVPGMSGIGVTTSASSGSPSSESVCGMKP